MNYSQKYFDEIFTDIIEDSVNKGLVSKADDFLAHIHNIEDISNYYVMSDAVYSKIFEMVYESITQVYESAKIEYATGEDLDSIGESRGVLRPEATHAMVNVTFSRNDSNIDDTISISEGIIIATDTGINYITLEEIYIHSGDLSTTVQCMSVESGVKGKVLQNTLTRIATNIGYNLRCTNPEDSSGGREAYSDEEYRDFVLNWFKINLKGSKEAFEYYFASLDGLDGYNIVPNFDVSGHSKIIVDPGTPYQLNQIYNDLQSEVSQMNEDLFVCAPDDVFINIYATVNVDIDQINPYSDFEKEDIKSRLVESIQVFIDGGYKNNGDYYPGLRIGEDFIPHKLQVFLDNEIPELKNITFNYPTNLQVISDEEKGKSNTIEVEMV